MRNRVLAAATLILAAVATAACDGGSATAPSDAQLTRAQALALNHAVFAVGAGFSDGGVPAGARGARLQSANGSSTFSFTFDTRQQCPAGGDVAVAGTIGGAVDAQASTAQVAANLAVAHTGCKVRTDDGAVFTLSGDPKIDVTLRAAASGASGVTDFHLTEIGGFTWDNGRGGSGRCTVDLSADLVTGTQNVRLTGNFCGFAVDGVIEHVGS
ncbi:MAG TPA: hypothetical protein VF092_05040 [Longimicrobium sp.]